MADRLLTRRQAAEYAKQKGAQLSEATIATWACRKPELLPSIPVGGRRYVRQSDLDRLLGVEADRVV